MRRRSRHSGRRVGKGHSREGGGVSQLRLRRGRAVLDYAGIRDWVPLIEYTQSFVPVPQFLYCEWQVREGGRAGLSGLYGVREAST